MITDKQIEEAISEEVRSEEDWWKSNGFGAYCNFCRQLIDKGFTLEDAVGLLGDCFWTAAQEYGG